MMPIRHRFRWALGAYAAIAAAAWFTLDGALRWIILILMAALALKSWIAVRREELQ